MSKNHVGKTVGVFDIVERMSYRDNSGGVLYKGICRECGFNRIAKYSDLKATIKCTHIGIDGETSFIKTDWSNIRIQHIFNSMKQRCYNKNNKSYKWYGAKGIKICKEWMDNPKCFEDWSVTNGYSDDLTIDRIDEDKDYSPDNCRWVTVADNTKYKSTTRTIQVGGISKTGREWAYFLGLGTNVINTYIRKYGIDNTAKFITEYIKNPNLKRENMNQSYYDLYIK